MKHKKILFVSGFLFFALQSCVYSDYLFQKQSSWVTEWLDASACAPPCWEGITPGETTLYQISKDTNKTSTKLDFDGPHAFSDGSFYFGWTYNENGNLYPAVQATTESNLDMTIGDLQFEFGLPGSYLSVNDIISHFGEPDYVGIDEDMAGCGAVIFYSDKRVWLRLERKKMGDNYIINKGTGLSRSYYLSESKRDERLKSFYPFRNQLESWNGYGEYQCK